MERGEILDALYRSREILLANIQLISQQTIQFVLGVLIFLLLLSGLVFSEEFKPSSWEASSKLMKKWQKQLGEDIRYLYDLPYADFVKAQDSAFKVQRNFILSTIDSNASTNEQMISFYRRVNRGFLLSDLPQIKVGRDSLYILYESWKQSKTQDSIYESQISQLGANQRPNQFALQQQKAEYNKRIENAFLNLENYLTFLKEKYPQFQIKLSDESLSIASSLKIIDAQIIVFEKDSVVKNWLNIKNSHPETLEWKLGAWKILDNDSLMKNWQKSLEILNTSDSLEVFAKIETDTSFVAVQQQITSQIKIRYEKERKIPTTDVLSVDIPLPTRELLLMLPALFVFSWIVLYILHFQREIAEIRIIRIEKKLQTLLGGERLVRTYTYEEDVFRPQGNLKYLKNREFSKWYENNPEIPREGFYYFAIFTLGLFLMYKWSLMVYYNPQVRIWAWIIGILSFIVIIVFSVIAKRVSQNILNRVRKNYS